MRCRLLFLLLCLIIGRQSSFADGTGDNHRKIVPDIPVKGGISAPCAGFLGDWLIVGGGCNFPDVPAADGGAKKYYKELYAICVAEDAPKWISIGSLPKPLAYASTVVYQDELICVGGMNAEGASSAVYSIRLQEGQNSLQTDTLPSLPVAIDNAAATLSENELYITGGNQSDGGQSLYMLDLKERKKWNKLSAYPGTRRVQPVLLSESGSLFLWGGFQGVSDSQKAVLANSILKYDREKMEWKHFKTIPSESDGTDRCLVGGAGVTVGSKQIVTGGVNYTIFRNALNGETDGNYMRHEPTWYRFNDDILSYDSDQDNWEVYPNVKGMAKAGGILLYHKGYLYMVTGELKPGIRTPSITTIYLESLRL